MRKKKDLVSQSRKTIFFKVSIDKVKNSKEFKLIRLENTSAALEIIREMEKANLFGKMAKNMKGIG